MKKLLKIVSMLVASGFLVAGIGGFIFNSLHITYPGPLAGYVFANEVIVSFIVYGVIAALIAYLMRDKNKMSGGRRAVPKPIILLLFTLLVAALLWYCKSMTLEEYLKLYRRLGEFVCKYDTLLIGLILLINIIHLTDLGLNIGIDKHSNASYCVGLGKIGYRHMFAQYFDGLYSNAPYFYKNSEVGRAFPRIIVNLFCSIVKFIYWVPILLVSVGISLIPGAYDAYLTENPDIAFTFVVLFFLINCDVLVFVLLKLSKLFSAKRYEIREIYSDGSTKTRTEVGSNLVAILFLAAILYMFYSAYYIFPLSGTIARMLETARAKTFFAKSEDAQTIADFYK